MSKKNEIKLSKKFYLDALQSAMKDTLTIDNSEIYLKANIEFSEIVKGNPISKGLPNDIIYAITMEGRTPMVISVNKNDGGLLKMKLTTWLSENGY